MRDLTDEELILLMISTTLHTSMIPNLYIWP